MEQRCNCHDSIAWANDDFIKQNMNKIFTWSVCCLFALTMVLNTARAQSADEDYIAKTIMPVMASALDATAQEIEDQEEGSGFNPVLFLADFLEYLHASRVESKNNDGAVESKE